MAGGGGGVFSACTGKGLDQAETCFGASMPGGAKEPFLISAGLALADLFGGEPQAFGLGISSLPLLSDSSASVFCTRSGMPGGASAGAGDAGSAGGAEAGAVGAEAGGSLATEDCRLLSEDLGEQLASYISIREFKLCSFMRLIDAMMDHLVRALPVELASLASSTTCLIRLSHVARSCLEKSESNWISSRKSTSKGGLTASTC